MNIRRPDDRTWRRDPWVRGLFALLSVTALTAQSWYPEDLDRDFERSVLIIETGNLTCRRFDIWLAATRAQQTRGLMFVRELPSDAGMLFTYPSSGRRSMWMKNTFLPLDILFIRAEGTIANIAEDTEPQSLASISSTEPVQFVLELNAGTSAALGIEPGDRVYF